MIDHQWLAIVFELTAFLLLFAALEVWSRKTSVRPETTRKLLHVGSGILTLAFPFVFVDLWPVVLLSGGAALVLAAARFVRFAVASSAASSAPAGASSTFHCRS